MLVRTFTKENERVLDPLAGVGGTLLGCSLSGRKGTGIEINQEWIEIYRQVCELESIPCQEMRHGDARGILDDLAKSETRFDYILTDVPYWKMDRVEKSKGTFKKVGEDAKGVFSDKSKLSPFNDTNTAPLESLGKDAWKRSMKEIFERCFKVLEPGRYCCVFIGNMYHDGKYHLLNADIAGILSDVGFTLKGEIVWYDVSNNLHLYGINYSWIPSIVHQFIMVFRKERKKKLTRDERNGIEKANINRIKNSGMRHEIIDS